MSRDSEFYDKPDEFDERRFYSGANARDSKSQSPEHELTGIERGNVVWGSGRFTCPGRWYASAMNKLIIASLLLRYDIRFPEGQSSRPPSIVRDGAMIPSPTQEICFKKLG